MSRAKGNLAEDLAVEYLMNLGFKIIERNFYSRFGEIDIVASKDETLHFIEVKSGERFEPVDNITPNKIEKIIKTINYYIMKNRLNMPYQIDAIIIKNSKIEYIENITF